MLLNKLWYFQFIFSLINQELTGDLDGVAGFGDLQVIDVAVSKCLAHLATDEADTHTPESHVYRFHEGAHGRKVVR